MTEEQEIELHRAVGEIRTDVKWLKENAADLKPRVGKLERRSSYMTGFGLALAAFCVKIGLPNVTSGFLPFNF